MTDRNKKCEKEIKKLKKLLKEYEKLRNRHREVSKRYYDDSSKKLSIDDSKEFEKKEYKLIDKEEAKVREINEVLSKFKSGGEFEDGLIRQDFRGYDFGATGKNGDKSIDMSNLNLTECNFMGSILARTNFENSVLVGANLSLVAAGNANFNNADLSKVIFNNTLPRNKEFVGEKLSESESKKFNRDKFFDKEYLKNINKRLPNDVLMFERTNLNRAGFNGTKFDSTVITNVDMEGSTVENASMNGTFFYKNINIKRVRFRGVDFSKTILKSDDNKRISFEGAVIDTSEIKTLLEEKDADVSGVIVRQPQQTQNITQNTIPGVTNNTQQHSEPKQNIPEQAQKQSQTHQERIQTEAQNKPHIENPENLSFKDKVKMLQSESKILGE